MPQMNPQESGMGFEIELADDEVRTLLYAVSETLRTWPGGDPEEQERLEMLKEAFFRMTLEMTYEA